MASNESNSGPKPTTTVVEIQNIPLPVTNQYDEWELSRGEKIGGPNYSFRSPAGARFVLEAIINLRDITDPTEALVSIGTGPDPETFLVHLPSEKLPQANQISSHYFVYHRLTIGAPLVRGQHVYVRLSPSPANTWNGHQCFFIFR